MIEMRDISLTFNKGNPNEMQVFEKLNLRIEQKDFIVLIGSNGSGKSTLLNLVAGSVSPDEGEILFDSADVTRLRDFERSSAVARIFQNPMTGTAPDLTILENFRLASLRTKRKGFQTTGIKFRNKVRERISTLQLGLEDKIDREMGSLSGGQRQALALVMATMDETKILLLDEPAAALDPRTSVLITDLAGKIINEFGLTALMVTHHVKDVMHYGSRMIQMKEGKVIRDIRDKSTIPGEAAIRQWFDE